MKEDIYLLYKHTFPNNKVYIGITKRKPEIRYGQNGYHYKPNKRMWDDIQKYGWDNIKHEIIYMNKTREEISELEREEIKKYKSNNPDFGYNIQVGGVYGKSSLYDEDEVIFLYEEGLTLKEIASKIGCCDRTASEIIHKYFPEDKNELIERANNLKKGEYIIPLEKRNKMKQLFEEGYTLKEISNKVGVGQCFATKFFKDLGYSHKEILDNYSSIKLCERENIEKMVLEGKTLKEIARIYKCSPDTVSNYIRKNISYLIENIKDNSLNKMKQSVITAVEQYSLSGEYIQTFSSIEDAARSLHKTDTHIGSCCIGTRQEALGFKWRYIDKIENSGVDTFITLPKEKQFYILGYFLRGINFLPQMDNTYNLRYDLHKKEDYLHLKTIGEILSSYMNKNITRENCFLLKGITKETKETLTSLIWNYEYIEKEINKDRTLYKYYLLGVYDSCAELKFTKISDAKIDFFFNDEEKALFIQKMLDKYIKKEKSNKIAVSTTKNGFLCYKCQWGGGRQSFLILDAIYEEVSFCLQRKYEKYLALKSLKYAGKV